MKSGCGRGQAGARFGAWFYEMHDQMLTTAAGLISKVTGGLSAPLGDNPDREE